MKKITVKQPPDKEDEVPTEIIASAIVSISEGIKKMRAGRLTDKARWGSGMTEAVKHTPGPWKVLKGAAEGDDMRCAVVVERGKMQYLLATIENGAPGDFCETEEANANLIASAPEMREEIEDFQRTFDLRWNADMRAIKHWQAANPGNDLTWPDHADLVVWLLEQLDASRALPPAGGWRDIASAPTGTVALFYDHTSQTVRDMAFVDWRVDGRFIQNPRRTATHWAQIIPPTASDKE